jgi:chromosome segregation ATPase
MLPFYPNTIANIKMPQKLRFHVCSENLQGFNNLTALVDKLITDTGDLSLQVSNQSEELKTAVALCQDDFLTRLDNATSNFTRGITEIQENITELTQNTSQAIALSNSILAKVIGEVNVTVTSLSDHVHGYLTEDIRENITEAVMALEKECVRNYTLLTADYTAGILNVSSAFESAQIQLNTSLLAAVHRAQTNADNMTHILDQRLNATTVALNESICSLSTTFSQTVLSMNNSLYTLSSTVQAVNDTFYADIHAVNATLVHSVHSLNDSLLSLNNSQLAATAILNASFESHSKAIDSTLHLLNASLLSTTAKLEQLNDTIETKILPANKEMVGNVVQLSESLLKLNSSTINIMADIEQIREEFNYSVADVSSRLARELQNLSVSTNAEIAAVNSSIQVSLNALNSSTTSIRELLSANVEQLQRELSSTNTGFVTMLKDATKQTNGELSAFNSSLTTRLNSVNSTLTTALTDAVTYIEKNLTLRDLAQQKAVLDYQGSLNATLKALEASDQLTLDRIELAETSIAGNFSLFNASMQALSQSISQQTAEMAANISSSLTETKATVLGSVSSLTAILTERISHQNESIQQLQQQYILTEDRIYQLNSNVSQTVIQVDNLKDAHNKLVSITDTVLPNVTQRLSSTEAVVRELQAERLSNSLPKLLEFFQNVTADKFQHLSNVTATLSNDMKLLLKSDAEQSAELKRISNLVDVKLPTAIDNIERDVSMMKSDLAVVTAGNKATSHSLATVDQEMKALTVQQSEFKGKFDSYVTSSTAMIESFKAEIDKKMTENARKQAEDVDKKLAEAEKKIIEAEKKVATVETRFSQQTQLLVASEAQLLSYEKRIKMLEEDAIKMRRELASQESVDSLRKLLTDLQTSMVAHSGKVLEVLLSNTKSFH